MNVRVMRFEEEEEVCSSMILLGGNAVGPSLGFYLLPHNLNFRIIGL